jgi:uncharacterized protein (TIGR00645 family)
MLKKILSQLIFSLRWVLYPINVGLFVALALYIGVFLSNIYSFLMHGFTPDMEHLMVILLGFVDASMVASLIVMIAQGGHQIFITKFDTAHAEEFPQYLDHIDTGILKVKIAQSIAGITLVQILKDFVNLEHVELGFGGPQNDHSRSHSSFSPLNGNHLESCSPSERQGK